MQREIPALMGTILINRTGVVPIINTGSIDALYETQSCPISSNLSKLFYPSVFRQTKTDCETSNILLSQPDMSSPTTTRSTPPAGKSASRI